MANSQLVGKRIVVTGAASGIGRAIALGVAGAGAELRAIDRDTPGLESTRDEIRRSAGSVSILELDLQDPGVAVTFAAALASLEGPVHGLVHAAGVHGHAPFEETTDEMFDRIIAVNLRAPFSLTRAALPYLSSPASVVLVGSGTVAMPGAGTSAYAASKGGLATLTKALTSELSPRGIRVNNLAPGWVGNTGITRDILADPAVLAGVTSLIPSGRVSEPSDIAKAANFLLSDDAEQIHGAYLAVDGGGSAAWPAGFDPTAITIPT
jgi:NAD(P)-dependent dehydrogenase (short-subunit alcohol dehydrogenase family)